MNWAEVLVYVLAGFLALFLVLAIILIALLIKVTRQIKQVTSTAERTIKGVEKVVVGFGSVSSPLAIAKLVARQVKKTKGRSAK